MNVAVGALLTLRFALELAGLVAFGMWGAAVGQGLAVRVALAASGRTAAAAVFGGVVAVDALFRVFGPS